MQGIKVGGESTKAHAHFLPCSISANGDAPVNQYFCSTIRPQTSGSGPYETATFRGRPLAGKELKLPDGYRATVLREENRPSTDVEERNVTATIHFDRFHYWNLENVPSDNDKLVQAMQWMDVAAAIHKPAVLSEE